MIVLHVLAQLEANSKAGGGPRESVQVGCLGCSMRPILRPVGVRDVLNEGMTPTGGGGISATTEKQHGV